MMSGIYAFLIVLINFIYHPLYLSVVDVAHNAETNSIELVTKTYIDDFETAIKTKYGISVDLLNEKNKTKNNEIVELYIKDHLQIIVADKALPLNFVGYEKKESSIWCYFEAENTAAPTKIQVATNILFEVSDKQNNIVNATVNNDRKTKRLSQPETNVIFEW